ncbi:restriction endonuclease subunit S [Staphylococcus sp. IVB6218]|uniref:restriction endonuclease subunit S n=1 Tax=Staphylococcus sp. IVB6218 TaxID=2989767 RepID=UPI0021CFC58D|nr:restriction endonuclease subunit S [Staphylococcus sp. IVB6218]UXR80484.1 restriction endonuclease subunit S [Staphylococcus sp. IVB6218]
MTNKIKNVPKLRFPEFKGEWGSIELGNIAENYTGGGTPSTKVKEYWEGNIPWIQSSDLKIDDVKNVEFHKYINSVAIENSSAKLIPENSIAIVTRVGVGKLALIRDEFSTSQDFLSLSNLLIDTNYALYALYKLIRKESTKLQGTSIKGLTKNDLLRKQIKKPLDINEQEQIGYFFSKLDRQIELEEQKLEKLEEQKKGYMQKIFSQELRFKDESGNEYPEWEEKKLFNVVKYLSSKRSSNYYSEDIIHGQYPVYDAVQEISRDTNFDIEESYISILKDGAGVGRLNLRPGKSSVIGTMGYLLPQNIDIKFLFYYLKTMNFNRFIIGSTIPHLYFKDYSKETILIPIDKSEQIKIGSFFIKLDSIINNKAKKIKVLKQRKQGFLQKMFI